MKRDHYVIGGIGAEVSNSEQRKILSGIISRAQQQNAQVVVLSNLHNPDKPETDSGTELRIYELIRSEIFDALILLSESLIYPPLKEKVCAELLARPDIPLLRDGSARLQREYTGWNLRSPMESQLTECRSIEQFAWIMGEFLYLVRDAVDIVLCLFEDWFSPSGSSERTLLYRSVNPWADHTVYSVPHTSCPALFPAAKKPQRAIFMRCILRSGCGWRSTCCFRPMTPRCISPNAAAIRTANIFCGSLRQRQAVPRSSTGIC